MTEQAAVTSALPPVVKGYVLNDGKVISSSYMDRYATKSEESRQLPADRFSGMYQADGLIEPLYNLEALTRLMEQNTYHMRAVRTKARDTVGLGWHLRAVNSEQPAEEERKRVEQFLQENCHPTLSFDEILERMMTDWEANGNGAIEVMRRDVRGPITGLAHAPSHTFRLHRDGKRLAQLRDGKKVWFKMRGADVDVDFKTGVVSALGSLAADRRATEILWFINYSSRSDYYGLPDILPATGAILGDISRRDYNIKFFEGHAIPAYAVIVTGADLDADLETAIHNFFNTSVKQNPHSTLVLTVPNAKNNDVTVQFQKLNVEVKEASFRLYRQDNRDEVMAAHAVPPYRAGIAETGSLGGSTAKESTEIYKASVIQPRQEMLERRIDRFIIRQGLRVMNWRFKFNEIDTADEAHDRAQHEAYFKMGALSPNDISERIYGVRDDTNPALNRRYINNVPVESMQPASMVEAIKSLHKELVQVVKAHVEPADSRSKAG